nr:unnamed protein product [Callosobruchus chinensis]
MSTIDLKSAYFLVRVKEQDQKYLRFLFEGYLYQFTCLPFVLHKLRSQGVMCVGYLDDLLMIGDTLQECNHNVKITVSLLEQLGFMINYEKSSLVPKTTQTFLGFIYDSSTQQVADKKLVQDQGSGQIYWHIKRLERAKHLALMQNDSNYEAIMPSPQDCTEDFLWWEKKISDSCNDTKTRKYSLEVYTESSLTYWGACSSWESTHGFWPELDKMAYINYLELLAIFNCMVQIYITDHIKTTFSLKTQPCLHIPFFSENKSICPASTLLKYIDATKGLRQNEDYLFLTYAGKHRRATKQTISRWVKCTLKEAGVDTSLFHPHSTQDSAVSAAKRAGVSIEEICRVV